MAVTAKYYGNFWKAALNKEVDINSDVIKLALLDNTHTPNQDTHDYFDDVVADEITGTGYTAGGATIGSLAVTYDAGTNTVKIDGADVAWPSSTFDARYAVLYVDTGTDSTSVLIGYVDFDGVLSPSNGTLSVVWSAAGIATATVS